MKERTMGVKQKAMKFAGKKASEGKKVDNRKLTDMKGFAVKVRRKMKGIDMLLQNMVTDDERKGIY